MVYLGFGYGLPKAVKGLLIANVIVFLATMLLGRGMIFYMFGLMPARVISPLPQVWRLFTYLFMHSDIGHIFFNMFGLWMFGAELEYNWGTRDFLKYYFVCGIGAGLLVILVSYTQLGNPFVTTVGASGAIFGILVAFGMMWPDRIIYFFGILPIKALNFVIIFAAITLIQGLTGTSGNVSWPAHLGGALTGFIYLKYGWRIAVYAEHFGKKMKRRRFHVVQGGKGSSRDDSLSRDEDRGRHPDHDAEVDRILDKIAREGMDSLTDRERKILDKASNRRG